VTGALNTIVEFWETADADRLLKRFAALGTRGVGADAVTTKIASNVESLPIVSVREQFIRASYFQSTGQTG
jgi:hypothetical protein